jgi:hypothetical protein
LRVVIARDARDDGHLALQVNVGGQWLGRRGSCGLGRRGLGFGFGHAGVRFRRVRFRRVRFGRVRFGRVRFRRVRFGGMFVLRLVFGLVLVLDGRLAVARGLALGGGLLLVGQLILNG